MGLYIDRGYTLAEAKTALLIEIDTWYGGATLDTFDCNVLGSLYRYECNEGAQLRMISGKVSNQPIPLICGQVPAQPDADPAWDWLVHTATECGKVHTAYTQFISDSSLKYTNYKTAANAATTVAAIETVLFQVYPHMAG